MEEKIYQKADAENLLHEENEGEAMQTKKPARRHFIAGTAALIAGMAPGLRASVWAVPDLTGAGRSPLDDDPGTGHLHVSASSRSFVADFATDLRETWRTAGGWPRHLSVETE